MLSGGVSVALLLAACSGVRVSADFDPTTDFSALETFDWLPDAKPPGDGPELDDPLLDARIRRAVESTLTGRGFRAAGTGAPDFWIAYHIGVERKVDVDTIYRSYGRVGWRGGGYADTVVREYEEGTLLIDVLRPGSGELLWRGSAQARLREQPSPEDREKRVREVVEKILQQFPPK
jgi:hypothetical protein